MALSVSSLDHGVDNSAGGFSTGSITPGTNDLILLCTVSNNANPTGLVPSNSAGLTWVQVLTVDVLVTRVITVWRALTSTPGTSAITFSNPNAVVVAWDILDVAGGVDGSGSNGSGAIRQSAGVSSAASPIDSGLVGFQASSAVIGVFGARDGGVVTTVGSGYTLLNDQFATGAKQTTEWRINATACGFSFTGIGDGSMAAIEAQTGSPPPPLPSAASWSSQGPILMRGPARMIASGMTPGPRIP